jgi:hypothetical protein
MRSRYLSTKEKSQRSSRVKFVFAAVGIAGLLSGCGLAVGSPVESSDASSGQLSIANLFDDSLSGGTQAASVDAAKLLADGEACSAAWDGDTVYREPAKVSYKGVNYVANYYSKGKAPDVNSGASTSQGQPWIIGSKCGGTGSGVSIPGPTMQLPTNYRLHTPNAYPIEQSDFDQYRRWFYIKDNNTTQVFRLFDSDVSTVETPPRIRVEAATIPWKAQDSNDWHSFEATYRADKIGGQQTRAIFQMKSPDTDVQWEVQINIDVNGDVRLNHRRNDDLVLGRNMLGVPFMIKVSSNGRSYRVWYNGSLIGTYAHQIDPSGNSSYRWRWGMYTQNQESDSTLVVWNLKYDL